MKSRNVPRPEIGRDTTMSTVGLAFDDPANVFLEPLFDAEPRIGVVDAFHIFGLEPL